MFWSPTILPLIYVRPVHIFLSPTVISTLRFVKVSELSQIDSSSELTHDSSHFTYVIWEKVVGRGGGGVRSNVL